MKKYNVCLVGATGMVGTTFLKILAEVNFPIGKLKLLASAKSAGKTIEFKGETLTIDELKPDAFTGYDLAFFSAGGDVSKQYAPIAAAAGLTVIDNSSAWREDANIGLVVPEVNFDAVSFNKIIANPNCSTIQSVIPLAALIKKYPLKNVFYSTYQAVSGSGYAGTNDLIAAQKGETPTFYPHNISQTAIPHIDVFLEDGYTKEEMKMANETKKILNLPHLPVSATCVRIPVANGHAVSVRVEFEDAYDIEEVRRLLSRQAGLVLVDDVANNNYPTTALANGTDAVYVGRIRRDLSSKNGLLFYCTADNIRKGAASNAVQIALKMIQENLL